jgi:2-polyprenyl-6-methoxyphenol hydroxylase-like FAD-dependent oxidoreductase
MAETNGESRTTETYRSHNGETHEQPCLRVIIAGAGIGGLVAAIALRQQGHRVEVYEQSRFNNEIGAAIHITPNAMGALRYIGIDPRDSGAVPLVQVRLMPPTEAWQKSNSIADKVYLVGQRRGAC